MKKSILIVFALMLGLNVFSQVRRFRNDMTPQTNRAPTEKDIEKRRKMMEERKAEYVENFLSTLDADDFQKQIIRQSLFSYFDAKIALYKTNFEHTLDRDQAIKTLDDSHFKELEELITEKDMAKIKEMIKGDFDEKEVKKEKKKKKRKKKSKD